jgi:hypothetical protein
MREIKKVAWDKFIETMDYDSDVNNFKYDFKYMTKNHGNAFIEYCKAMWEANEGVQTEEEFMKMNANMPKGFFDKVIKGE